MAVGCTAILITIRTSLEPSPRRLQAFVTVGTIDKPALCGNTSAAVVARNLLHSAASFLVVPDQEYGVPVPPRGIRDWGSGGITTVS